MNPDEKQPKYDEFSVSLERELIPNLAVRGTGVYSTHQERHSGPEQPASRMTRTTFRSRTGTREPDGSVGNADDPGTSITYFEFAPELAGRQFEQFMPVNDPNVNQSYKGFELAVMKRLSNRWQFMGSYCGHEERHPDLRISWPPAALPPAALTRRIEVGNLTPNDEINRADRTWEWNGKLMGVVRLPGSTSSCRPTTSTEAATCSRARCGSPGADDSGDRA